MILETTGLGVSAAVVVDVNDLTLSLGGTATHQLLVTIVDVAGAASPGTAFTLTAAADASGGNTVYTGTITGGDTNAFLGRTFVVSGFALAANKGTFLCKASTATTLTLDNSSGASETHAGTATEEGKQATTFFSRDTGIATVSTSGLITAIAIGETEVRVEYPTFDNGRGTISNTGSPENGRYWERIWAPVRVKVRA